MSDKNSNIDKIAKLIHDSSANNPVEKTLETSERVLKRITDGIYRQTSSALRELISNAYDADATRVIIETDRPRFKEITVRDNGNGFTEKALASLICSIGGSPKRTYDGCALGVTQEGNPDLSPNGRRLIGKIGIGLFAVAQLTKKFKIITKVKGSNYRTVAYIILKTHSEDELKKETISKFETGKVRIWNESASDIESHGTEVILFDLLPKTQEELRSTDKWILSNADYGDENEGNETIPPPKFHIGCVFKNDENSIEEKPSLPWKEDVSPKEKFKQLIKAVQDETGNSYPNPKLEVLLDNYLKMIWTLAIQSPVEYIGKHPLEINNEDEIIPFQLENRSKGSTKEIKLEQGENIAQYLDITNWIPKYNEDVFEVYIDGVQLLRPISFEKNLTSHAIKTPLIFWGVDKPDLSRIPEEIRGGELEFVAYLFWQPKVVPVEHRGVLVRINNSNGTLFDNTFMQYPVSEQTRKNQITAEIFVKEGMDAALNIDRESFNYSHPHYQYLAKWLHNAFRQFATAHKKLGKKIREENLIEETVEQSEKLDAFVHDKIEAIFPESNFPAVVEIVNDNSQVLDDRKKGKLIYTKNKVLPPSHSRLQSRTVALELMFEGKMKAIASVLAAYGVFDEMPYDKQEKLLLTIAEIIDFGE